MNNTTLTIWLLRTWIPAISHELVRELSGIGSGAFIIFTKLQAKSF